jgi:CIC family chloride channel protein
VSETGDPPTATADAPVSPKSAPAIERAIPFHELGDFTTVDRRTAYLAALGGILGVAGAVVAALLLGLIGLFTNLFYYGRLSWSFVSPAGNSLGLLALGIPVAGGLLVGLMARFGSERIRGHGIPEAIESILVHKSRVDPRVTVLKPLSAAISIGSGGPFGAEGPIIMTGGSLGSVFGQTLRLSAAERKTLLVAGAAAGMAATFNTPVAAALLAVELLLFEWRPRSLIPVGVASVVATIVRWQLLGSAPLFPLPPGGAPGAAVVLGAVIVGMAAGALATALTYAVYAFEDLYRRLPVHWMWWPAIGGIAIGTGGLLDPQVLGVGYGTIDLLLAGGLGLAAIALLLIVKAFVWTASLGSGTSGGVLAPLMMMGASTGAILGTFLPGGGPDLFALVALGAILGGTLRTPFTGVVFALELTHDLSVLLPLFIASLAAYGVTVFTLRRSILTEKIARRHVHAAREYAVDPLEILPVRAVMHPEIVYLPETLRVEEVGRLTPDAMGRYVGYPLVSDSGEVRRFVTRAEIAEYLTAGGDPRRPLREIAWAPGTRLEPDHPARVGAAWLAELDRESLPVVDPEDPSRYIGVFAREDVFRARVLALQDEQQRDRALRVTLPRIRLPVREPPPPPSTSSGGARRGG